MDVLHLAIWLAMHQQSPLPARIEWALEYTESGGVPTAKSGPYMGLWQVDPRWASRPVRNDPSLLYIPAVARNEGRRLLHYWLGKSRGDMARALAAYQCGYGGLSGKCGKAYSVKVMRRAKEAHWSVEYLADHCRTCPECCVED
jgi:hypothetical protein